MKKIEAIIRPEKLHNLRQVLDSRGYFGMTAYEVKGRGRQKGIALQWRAGDYRVDFMPKMKVEMVVEDDQMDQVVDLICSTVQTGEAGDGKIFVYPVEDVIRVRTRERGGGAV
ncbi:MAG: putative nitrogen regulatory PII-like protein [Methanosaeta sp. PtaB.Bin039]|nr:MAG: putative nitrogen regulatory PII-like protein [Methanosaeta sp. PtaB.Bin039]OPY45294.1 MAG: putative nitrogen regulatory PII-like protein [Methanosaeta sp. PtaU1.Bin028]HOT06794.1 P-II family nitrogen regulator [Methanotrichaceae archaeon]HQF15992.1 P-II family nitrogen regulator [Methanotrichaceae archaeon]HQI90660.1 P-II family nitrogen regulator [Methanotrichaceae archaeon]